MTPDLEQLADEAIRLRHAETRRAASLPDSVRAKHEASLTARWDRCNPQLARLADQRLTALGTDQGTTPDPGCTATHGTVTLEAVRDTHPTEHRYRIVQLSKPGTPRVGTAWLSTGHAEMPGARYIVQINGERWYGDDLDAALQWAAIATSRDRGAR